jgi:outer membrane receptor protein involved in Fe transport
VQANYTYIDADATPPQAFLDNDNDGQPDPGSFESSLRWGISGLLGQSRHTANLIGIYQDDALEMRLAYNWRSEYLNSYRDFVTGNPIIQKAAGFLDFSVRYDITENVQVAFLGANLLDTKSKSETQIDQEDQRYQRSSFLNDRRFKFSIRYQY